jgi:hypothetical protein
MAIKQFVESLVRETFARLGDSAKNTTKKPIYGQSGLPQAVEFETEQTMAVWLPMRDVIVFRQKNGRHQMRIVNLRETMRARGIAA